MIDICFSDITKNFIDLFLNTKQEEGYISRIKYPAPEMEEILLSPSDERISLAFWLDTHNIDSAHFAKGRIDALRPYYRRKFRARRIYKGYMQDVQRIVAEAQKGTPVRIWYSSFAYSMCGMYYICSQLENICANIILIPLPMDDRYKSWCDVDPIEVRQYLHLAHRATKEEIAANAAEWKRLCEENGVLRVNENGKIKSVQTDYFDTYLLSAVTDTPIQMINLIGITLGKVYDENNYVVDGYLCDRILKLIDRGQIKIAGKYTTRNKSDRYPHYLLQKP